MSSDYENRLANHAALVNKIRNDLLDQAAKTKQRAFAAREATIRKRAESIQRIRESLQETTTLIQSKHESISHKINQESIHRDANIRVNRGLEALEKFIQILRETDLTSEMIEKAIRDPIISQSIMSEARKAIASDFFKSMQRQLVMQTEFINIAAHELRTPIMPILVNTEILEQELGDKYPELQLISRNARRLERLTDNILNVARIESGTLKLNKISFDLNHAIKNTLSDERAKLENKNVNLILESTGKLYVVADKDRIVQVVSNLISNALKFTKQGSITVTTKLVEDKVEVTVQDTGSGIPPEILPVLFSKFATKSDRGTGLGLYICKNIVEAHGGRMQAGNSDSGGAVFTFSLSVKA